MCGNRNQQFKEILNTAVLNSQLIHLHWEMSTNQVLTTTGPDKNDWHLNDKTTLMF